jgi:hypothetical protein
MITINNAPIPTREIGFYQRFVTKNKKGSDATQNPILRGKPYRLQVASQQSLFLFRFTL